MKNGQFDNFHETTADAEEQIRAGLEIFHEIGINTNVFIPPAWKLNNSSIEVLEKLGFKLGEEQEEYLLLLSQQEFKKIRTISSINTAGLNNIIPPYHITAVFSSLSLILPL
jgi:predicted deacetylase